MIVLKTLKWGNMFSYGDNNEINFNSNDKVIQITGVNGSGKSSINLILEELLYNKNSRQIKKSDILNRDIAATSYWAELGFSIGSTEYTVVLERAKSAKLVLLKNGEDISGHTAAQTYKTIASILGDDFSTFTQKLYQGTASSLQFLTATDSSRKKFLVGLLGLEVYGEYGESIKEYARDLGAELKALEDSLGSNLALLKKNTLGKDDDYVDEPPLPGQQDYTADIDLISELKAKASNITKHNKSVDLREKLEAEEAVNTEKLRTLNAPERPTSAPDLTRLDELTSTLAELKAKHTAAQVIVKKIKNLEGQCPTCLSDIDEERVASLIASNKENMSTAIEDAKPLKIESSSIATTVTESRVYTKALATYSALVEKTKASLDTLVERLGGLETEKLDKARLLEDISEATKSLSASQCKDSIALAEYKDALAFNAKLKATKEAYALYSNSIKEQRIALTIAADEADKVTLLKEAFSPNGLVALKINQAVQDLQRFINEYLSEFSSGRFTLHFILEGDKLNVKIQDRGALVGIQALSSGQLARVNIAAVLAIRKLLTANSTSSINLLFLDEITSTLDAEGKEQLVEILLQEPALNTLIVMHSWQHSLVPVLEVKTGPKGSYIEEVK